MSFASPLQQTIKHLLRTAGVHAEDHCIQFMAKCYILLACENRNLPERSIHMQALLWIPFLQLQMQ